MKWKILNIFIEKFEVENFEHLHSNTRVNLKLCWYQPLQKWLFEIYEVKIRYQPHKKCGVGWMGGLMDGWMDGWVDGCGW